MKVCVLSHWGEGAWFAWLMKQAGHDVHFSVEAEANQGVLAGLIEQSEIGNPADYDLMVFDTTGFGALSDESRKLTPTVGDSSFADQLEHDRLFGIEFMQRAGIKVPAYEHFTDVSAALKFIRKTKKVYVFKPCGEGADTAATYVSKSAEDLERYIDVLWRSAPVKEFILQEVVKGTEVSTEMWMNESGYYFLNHTLECKKLMTGDLGPATGCSGNLVFAIERENPIFNQGLRKAFEPLREAGYVGMIDLNAIVTEGELFGLEWTPRFGYEGTCNIASLLPMDFAEFMYRVAANQKLPDLTPKHSFCAAVRLSIPPYPNDGLPKKAYKQGVPVEGMSKKLLEHFYALDLRLNETNDELFETAGINGWLGAALGCGETIGQAFGHAQGVIDSLRVPDLMYRTDVRSVTAKRYMELHNGGWLKATYGD